MVAFPLDSPRLYTIPPASLPNQPRSLRPRLAEDLLGDLVRAEPVGRPRLALRIQGLDALRDFGSGIERGEVEPSAVVLDRLPHGDLSLAGQEPVDDQLPIGRAHV